MLLYKPYIYLKHNFHLLFELKSQISKQSIQTSVRFLLTSVLASAYSATTQSLPLVTTSMKTWVLFMQFILKSAFMSWHVPLCESAAQVVRASFCFDARAGAAWVFCLDCMLNTVIGTWEVCLWTSAVLYCSYYISNA